jgi:hypothetical protein
MRATRWAMLGTAIALGLVLTATLTSASAPGNDRRRIRSGWLGTGRSAANSAERTASSAVKADKTIRTIFVQENFLLNSVRDGFAEFVVSGPLYNPAETRRVGFGIVRCAVAVPDEGLAECDGTFNLGRPFPRGAQITIQGLSSPATHWFNAITGGTGKYREVDGQVEARNIGTTNKVETIFHLEF